MFTDGKAFKSSLSPIEDDEKIVLDKFKQLNNKEFVRIQLIQKEDKYLINQFDKRGLKDSITLSSLKHVYTDETFGSINFSENGDKIIFISEKIEEDIGNLFEEKGEHKFDHFPSFGEGL